MLISAASLLGYPVLSLQLGGPIARTTKAVIDPAQLKIIAFFVEGPKIDSSMCILDLKSVREMSNIGMIIDAADELVGRDDVIKISETIKLNFGLVGLRVETKKGTKLGKVIDFNVDTNTFMVQQIIVRRPSFKAIMDPELTIGRTEVLEVHDHKIVVKEEKQKLQAKSSRSQEAFVPNYVNPFREPRYAPSDNQSPGATDTE